MSGDSLTAGDAAQASLPLEAAHPPLSKDVFISYASQDAAVANSVVETLESQGIRCWIAPRDVTPGEFYAGVIVHAIDGAKAAVLILSQHSAASPHVVREVERAVSKRHPIISLRIDRAPLPADLEYFLNTSQWLDASEGDVGRVLPKLTDAVWKVLRGRSAVGGGYSEPPAITVDPTRGPVLRRSRRPIAAVFGVIVVLILGFAVDKWWLSRRTQSPQRTAANVPTNSPVVFAPPPHSLAVLPFVNMSGDASQEYFSDGITEELLNSLSRVNELQVVARTSSFSFKGQNVDVSTIAHKLNVGAVLEGSVRRSGNTVRITVQLINAISGFHIWSQTYDRKLTDILKVQGEVATTVAQRLKIALAGDETAKLELGGSNNPDAYEAYLRGVEVLSNWDLGDADLRTALTAFDRAISLDSNYALAHSKRAVTLNDIAIFAAKAPEIAGLRKDALQSAQRGVALAPELGETHLVLAQVQSQGLLDFAGAAPEFDRALALSPGSARVQRGFAGFSGQLGHFEQAIRAARRAVTLDPQNVDSHITLGQVLTWARDYGKALAALHNAEVLKPNSLYVRGNIANAMLASGRFEESRLLCESTIPPQHPIRQLCLAVAYQGLGRHSEARQELERLVAAHPDAGVEIAGIYAQLGDLETALKVLVRAEQQRDSSLQVLRVYWALDPIRDEPQFKAILERMNFPP